MIQIPNGTTEVNLKDPRETNEENALQRWNFGFTSFAWIDLIVFVQR